MSLADDVLHHTASDERTFDDRGTALTRPRQCLHQSRVLAPMRV